MVSAEDEIAAATETASEPDLGPVANLCDGSACYLTDGDRRYIYMENLNFLVEGEEKRMDALLCLNYPNEQYPTKLYFAENLKYGLNWNDSPYILGRQWFSWSWKGVSPDQSPLEILAGHLEAFQ